MGERGKLIRGAGRSETYCWFSLRNCRTVAGEGYRNHMCFSCTETQPSSQRWEDARKLLSHSRGRMIFGTTPNYTKNNWSGAGSGKTTLRQKSSGGVPLRGEGGG